MVTNSAISKKYGSWGKFPRVTQSVDIMTDRSGVLPDIQSTLLPYGRGRSYGDSCLNDNAQILSTQRLDHLISFDR
jgi:hypothetical protein